MTTTTIATAKVVTTEPATETVTTKSSAATEPTQATSTTSTPAATSAALEYGCGKTHWDNDQEKIDSNQCRFLCNCEGDCDQSSGMCNVDDNQSCPKGYEGKIDLSGVIVDPYEGALIPEVVRQISNGITD